jgi:hypothetical protein
MAVGDPDVYTFRSGSVANTVTTANPLLSVVAGTTVRGLVVGVRVEVGVTTAVAGNSLLFQLCRPGNTMTGTTTTTGQPHDFSAPASILTGYTAWSTAPTVGAILAEWQLPQTTGSMWEEFPPTGYEWQIPAIANAAANAGLHLFVTASVATSTPVFVNLVTVQ